MNEPQILADTLETLDLGRLLGQRRAFGAVAGRCSAAHAQLLRRPRPTPPPHPRRKTLPPPHPILACLLLRLPRPQPPPCRPPHRPPQPLRPGLLRVLPTRRYLASAVSCHPTRRP